VYENEDIILREVRWGLGGDEKVTSGRALRPIFAYVAKGDL
jgi:hypothetical protein